LWQFTAAGRGAGIAARILFDSAHAADPGIIPVVITDACGAGHADAAQRSCEALPLPATPS